MFYGRPGLLHNPGTFVANGKRIGHNLTADFSGHIIVNIGATNTYCLHTHQDLVVLLQVWNRHIAAHHLPDPG
jgi:hypothetical protein